MLNKISKLQFLICFVSIGQEISVFIFDLNFKVNGLIQGTQDVKFFSKPNCLVRLARFTLEAYCSVVCILLFPMSLIMRDLIG